MRPPEIGELAKHLIQVDAARIGGEGLGNRDRHRESVLEASDLGAELLW